MPNVHCSLLVNVEFLRWQLTGQLYYFTINISIPSSAIIQTASVSFTRLHITLTNFLKTTQIGRIWERPYFSIHNIWCPKTGIGEIKHTSVYNRLIPFGAIWIGFMPAMTRTVSPETVLCALVAPNVVCLLIGSIFSLSNFCFIASSDSSFEVTTLASSRLEVQSQIPDSVFGFDAVCFHFQFLHLFSSADQLHFRLVFGQRQSDRNVPPPVLRQISPPN